MAVKIGQAPTISDTADRVGQFNPRLGGSPDSAIGGTRANTVASRRQAVEQVILAMQKRMHEPLSLQTMANIALLSPYHFNRVFRFITGITPCRYLTVLRMEAAKRLLLSTQLSVSEVCFGVGFKSQGSFTRDFTRFVGLSPHRLRRLAAGFDPCVLVSPHHGTDVPQAPTLGVNVTGRVAGPEAFEGLVFVGLFTTPFPQGRPAGCALLARLNTTYGVAHVPDGRYHVFAAAFEQTEDPLTLLTPDYNTLLVGTSASSVLVREGQTAGPTDVTLRPMRLTDPPILVALPALLAEGLKRPAEARHYAASAVCPS
jgi:AraC family transcriptional regulator